MNKLSTKIALFLCFALQTSIFCNNNDALLDLEFMHTMLLNNHPGMYNDEDPDFNTHLNNAFTEYYQKIYNSCADESVSLLIDFAKSFNDSHLRVSFAGAHPTHQQRQPKQFYSAKLSDKVQWISLPTFEPNENEQTALSKIIADLPTMRSENLIVFDVRGNGGGNSFWAKDIVTHLFGESYAQSMIEHAERNVYVEWRASTDNINHLKRLSATFEAQYGIDNETVKWLTTTIQNLQQAYDQGLHLYSDKNIININISKPNLQNPVTAKIIVIIDKGCGSACLDFIDYLKAMEHDVILFGQTTSADTVYMEVHTVDLPSKTGTFGFPMKVYRNRPRGNNIPYYPDIPYDGDINDTDTLQQTIINLFD